MSDIETDIEDLAQIIAGQALRIEALEAALRETADLVDVEGRQTIDHCYSMARAAIDKDTGT